MQFNLVPHPDTPPSQPFKLWANVDLSASFGASATLNLWFGVGAPAERFVRPEGDPIRSDELWRTTCFEAFLKRHSETSYREWNFAPSGAWAAYDFVRYREGLVQAEVGASPYIRVEDNLTWWALGATVAVPAGEQWQLGLSAVLEERDGTSSYWALAHALGKPDFHAADCFIARLP